MFSLRLFGGAVLSGPDGLVTGRLAQRRRLALLAVLAVERHPISRDRLLGLFWPEAGADRARHSLADSIYQIRRQLGDNAVVAHGEDLRLDSSVIECDVAGFEDALARGDLDTAATLYCGPFLDGFHLNDAPDFERWIDTHRDRLARAHARALEQLADDAAAAGDLTRACDAWRRMSATDPLNARIVLHLMAALEAAGDRAAAIQHARTHAALLEQELGAAADPEVAAFAERLRRNPAMTGASNAPNAQDAPNTPIAPIAHAMKAPGAAETPSAAIARGGRDVQIPQRGRRSVLAGLAIVMAVVALLLVDLYRNGGSSAGERPHDVARTLVVLPCSNPGGDPADEYFSDGLTEELIATLSQTHDLRVVARTSAFAFKGETLDVREIARVLDVATVVECSVRRADDHFRVTAQLINAEDGLHLWADTYQREGDDVLAIQIDLALRIAQALRMRLTPGEQARLRRQPTSVPEAHALYLKGRHFWNQRTPGAYRQAIDYFERAIALDSSYAEPWAGLARAYSLQGLSGLIPLTEARERMGAAVRRAVELDAASAEAHAELGAYLYLYEWDTAAAERAYQHAIALAPEYSIAHHLYGNMLSGTGRHEEALAQKRIAVRLDPLSPQLNVNLGTALLLAGRTDEALRAFEDAIELDTTAWAALSGISELHVMAGNVRDAVEQQRRVTALAPGQPEPLARLAAMLAYAGDTAEARRIITPLREESERRATFPPNIGVAMLALGDVDAARDWFERAWQQRQPRLRLAGGSPWIANISDPVIQDVLARSRQ